MASPSSHFSLFTRTNLHLLLYPTPLNNNKHFQFHHLVVGGVGGGNEKKNRGNQRRRGFFATRVSNNDSYLDMWKQAVDRERKELEFQKIAENSSKVVVDGDHDDDGKEEDVNPQVLEKKSDEFKKILEVPKEERDRIQRMQVIDRAAAALAAAQALLKEAPPLNKASSSDAADSVSGSDSSSSTMVIEINDDSDSELEEGVQGGKIFVNPSGNSGQGTPGPNFWSWTPPVDDGDTTSDVNLQIAGKPTSSPSSSFPVIEKERLVDSLAIPFQSTLSEKHNPPLPPLQSLVDVGDVKPKLETPTVEEEHQHDVQFAANAAEAAEALNMVEESLPSSEGVNPDGSRWWKETGIEQRPGGVVYKWTLLRGVSADGSMEWEDKFWEATGDFEFKELGSEKSGRDVYGNVWREYWKEAMWKDYNTGLVHMEKNADKWGKNGMGGQWHEKWWEQYDALGRAEKWADKWCSIDPNTPLEPGHAHVWHERWGEKYDGQGASIKYTDKWAERSEGDGWSKWGDKWDENFNQHGQGVKQGESWWQGKYGDRWNRTWGEGHNGSGWIHKYGKSSCGEHWDTHVQQDTWYERYPHFGFEHCFENSVQLREVQKPPETS